MVQVRGDTDFDAALKIVQTDTGIGLMQQIDAVLGAMRVEEQRLLAERVDAMESRSAWVRGLVVGGAILAIAALLWAVRLLNQAWSRSYRAEAEQRTLGAAAARVARQPEPGRRGIRAGARAAHWNECFQILLDLPRRWSAPVRPMPPSSSILADGDDLLETEEQIRARPPLPR